MQSAFSAVQKPIHFPLDKDYFIQWIALFTICSTRARVVKGKFKCWFHYIIIMLYTSDYALKLTGWWFNNIEFLLDCTKMYSVQTLATEHGLSLTVTCSCLLVPLCRNQKVATETTKLWKFWGKKIILHSIWPPIFTHCRVQYKDSRDGSKFPGFETN